MRMREKGWRPLASMGGELSGLRRGAQQSRAVRDARRTCSEEASLVITNSPDWAEIDKLVRQAKPADTTRHEALGRLILLCRPLLVSLYSELRYGRGNRSEAEDFAQELCLTVFKKWDKFYGAGSEEFWGWVRTTAVRKVMREVQ